MKMNGDTENKTEELIKALELHIRETMPETCSSWQLFINCQGWEVEAINRSPEVLARDGISMRNLRGEFIK